MGQTIQYFHLSDPKFRFLYKQCVCRSFDQLKKELADRDLSCFSCTCVVLHSLADMGRDSFT